jgi:hypothetical protein
MRTKLLALIVSVLTLSGCATGFQVTGPRGGGVAAGAGIGPPANPIVIQEPVTLTPTVAMPLPSR